MQSPDVTHDCAADHNVMKVSNDEIRVMDMHVNSQASQEKTREAANGEQADEAESVEHGGVPGNRAFVERRGPVKDLDRRRNGNNIAEEGKRKRRVGGHAGNEQMVRPNQKADDGDGDTRSGNKVVSE